MAADGEKRTRAERHKTKRWRDGAAVSEESVLKIRATRSSEFLLFELN